MVINNSRGIKIEKNNGNKKIASYPPTALF
jgi:hypothetical protein